MIAALEPLRPARLVTALGGHGVAAVWKVPEPGPTVMFRAELDALPIEELSVSAGTSTVTGKRSPQ